MANNQQQQQHQPQRVRSIHNRVKSFVRFFNATDYTVQVYWIDHYGKPVCYQVLGSRQFIDINTFVTHPWIFVENETKDRFVVNGSKVFFPEPWDAKYRGMRLAELPARAERTIVRISVPLYSLRDVCLRFIKRRLRSDRHAYDLDLPRMLQYELYYQRPRKSDLITEEQRQQEPSVSGDEENDNNNGAEANDH